MKNKKIKKLTLKYLEAYLITNSEVLEKSEIDELVSLIIIYKANK